MNLLDIPNIKKKENELNIYNFKDLDSVISSIKTEIKINPFAECVFGVANYNHDYRDYTIGKINSLGFQMYIYREVSTKWNAFIRLRGFKVWVYFKDKKPIYFTRAGVGCLTPSPPHLSMPDSWLSENEKFAYKNFDTYELVEV